MSFLAAVVATPAAAAVLWAILRSPLARRVVAAPSDERWHTRATPSLGGIGIFAGLLAGVGACLLTGAVEPSGELFGILGGCGILFAAGLLDDLVGFGPAAKLAAQLAATATVLLSGLRVEIVGNDALALAIAVLWLVGMTNAFNLLDNMDGLAATLAAIACAYFAINAATVQSDPVVLALSLGAGLACLGFLPFNVRRGPALLFMGDSGSQVLGFALAALGLATSWKVAGTTVATLLLPILVLAIPILDTALVTVVRLLEGRPIYRGARDHTSHRLVYRGLSEKRALILLAVIAAALGATSLTYTVLDRSQITAVGVLVTFAALVQFASLLADVDRGESGRSARRSLLGSFVVSPRRLVEVVVDSALIAAAFLGAYLLEVTGKGTVYQRHIFSVSLPVVLAARYLLFIPLGLYRSVWRYAGALDALRLTAAVGCSELLAYAVLEATQAFGDFPRSVFVIDAFLCIALVGAARFAERGLPPAFTALNDRSARRRTVIVGAGRGGRSLLRELRETPGEQVVGFVDDDRRLAGRRLQGVRVVGPIDEIERVLAEVSPETVLVTIPGAPRDRLDALVRECARAGVTCRFVRRETDLDPEAVLSATSR